MKTSNNLHPTKIGFCFFLLCSITLGCKIKEEKNKKEFALVEDSIKPNVVFILVDDLGWKDLSSYGSQFYETPNIDQLAFISTSFTNAYTPNPVCSPTRASILTGKYPSRVGITDWIPGKDPKNEKLLGPEDFDQLPLHETTIAETMKQANYKTFFAGKWHLGGEGFLPTDQGFDINKGGYHYGQPPGGYYSPYKNKKLSDGPEGEYLTDRLTTESIEFIEKNKEDPFLLYLSFYTVHTPIQANTKFLSKFEKKRNALKDTLPIMQKERKAFTLQNQTNADYASMIYALDKNVGRILDKLTELKLLDETLIILTSDNGGLSTLESGRKTPPTSNIPLRAGKGWAYEGGIRVPLIIKPPGETKKNVLRTPVISMDLYPTILDFVGLKKIPEQHKDGESLYSLIREGKKLDRESLFFHFPHYHGSAWTPGSAIRKGDWKLIHFYEDGQNELYNLARDFGERNDLSGTHPDKLAELKKDLLQLQKAALAKEPKRNE